MATKIVTKNSSTASAVPTASDLVQGELAVNVADKKLFTEDNSGAIIELADGVKLAGIEASADVTDTANVTAAGAVMDSELTSEASVKALNQGVATTDSPAFAGLTVDTTTLAVDSTNNRVGIGTSSPSNHLHVYQPGSVNAIVNIERATGNTASLTAGASTGFTINSDNSNGGEAVTRFTQNSSEAMRIDSSGKVGIGTTAPAGPLHVYGSDYVYIGPNVANKTPDSTQAGIAMGWNKSSGQGESIISFNKGAGSPGGLVFSDYSGTYAERMRIDSSGNVGIGTASPTFKLDVAGNARANYFALRGNESAPSESAFVYRPATGVLGFGTGTAERMRIDSTGAVLVGKTSSSVSVQGFITLGSGGVYSSIPSGNTYHVYDTTNNNFTFYVGSTGGVINYQANNVNLSDEREKKNIEPLESKWDSVKSWSLKTFHYNHQADESIKNYGVIAQDVEQTNPEAIDVYQKDENTERKGVKEQQMMWMAIKALQEAQTRIETLETRIAALEE